MNLALSLKQQDEREFKRLLMYLLNVGKAVLSVSWNETGHASFKPFFVLRVRCAQSGQYAIWPSTFFSLNTLKLTIHELLFPYSIVSSFIEQLGYNNSEYKLST